MSGDAGGVDPRVPGFEQYEPIGWGGFGAAFRAFQPSLNRHVAIKILVAAGLDDKVGAASSAGNRPWAASPPTPPSSPCTSRASPNRGSPTWPWS